MKNCLKVLCFIIFCISCTPAKKVATTPVPVAQQAPVLKPDTLPIAPPVVEFTPYVPKKTVNSRTDVFLQELLKSRPRFFQNVLDYRDSLKVQIIYTKIDRQPDNSPVFTPYYFNVSDESYFYPASTVKFPVALMALQKMNELKVVGLTSRASMITESSYGSQTPVFNEPTSPDGRPSIAQYIKQIFLVSDNNAFNRLYEFLGQQYINDRLHAMGFEKADILHRLNISLSEDENRHSNAVSFFTEGGKSLYSQPMQVSTLVYPVRTDSLGVGYFAGNQLVSAPMPFAGKNRLGIEALTGMLKGIMFPASVPEKQRFNLSQDDYRFIYQYMSQFPRETMFPAYDSSSYPDAYLKFLLNGAQRDTLPKNIRIFNKSGDAYGFLTDVAYIVDFDKNIEFMLSATIYCNSDGILNDDRYDYDSVGLPFMKELGKLVYDYEEKRQRVHKPDVSAFKMRYDK